MAMNEESSRSAEEEEVTEPKEEKIIDLFSTLPDEVLEVVLDYVEDSKDRANLAKVSWNCEKILNPTRTTWLFHAVIPHIIEYLELREVFNCRSVCKAWMEGVDDYLLEEALLWEPWMKSYSFHVMNSGTVVRFLYLMSQHNVCNKNPFVGRRVTFGTFPRSTRTDTRYWSNVLRLASHFGHHIWDCTLNIEETPVNFMYVLRGLLARLRELRCLRIFHSVLNSVGTYRNRRMKCMLEYFDHHPLPTLPRLEHLEVLGACDIFYDLVLPTYAKQLRSLKLECYLRPSSVANFSSVISDMPKLEYLKIAILRRTDVEKILASLNSPLHTVIIDLTSVGNINFSYILKLLRNCAATLKTLEIDNGARTRKYGCDAIEESHWNCSFSAASSNPIVSEFKNLERLKMNCKEDIPCTLLKNLSSLKSLKHLELSWKKILEYKCTQIVQRISNHPGAAHDVQIFGYEDIMYESNIWRILPKLKTCVIETYFTSHGTSSRETTHLRYSYTREGRERESAQVQEAPAGDEVDNEEVAQVQEEEERTEEEAPKEMVGAEGGNGLGDLNLN